MWGTVKDTGCHMSLRGFGDQGRVRRKRDSLSLPRYVCVWQLLMVFLLRRGYSGRLIVWEIYSWRLEVPLGWCLMRIWAGNGTVCVEGGSHGELGSGDWGRLGPPCGLP